MTARWDTPALMVGSHFGRRRVWLALLVLAAAVALLLAFSGHWNHRQRSQRITAAVPALPDLRTAPRELQERLQRARASALEPATALGGLAEYGRLCHANLHAAEAEACWRLLAAEEPRNAHWTYYLADLRGQASDAPAMVEWLIKTTVLAPDYAPAWLRLGDLLFKTGQLDEAQRAYQRRLALVPDDPYASLGIARIALQHGEAKRARELIEQLVATAPEFPPAHNLYAEMLAAAGDAAAATRERMRGTETGRFREAEDPWLEELMGWCFNYERLCVRGTVDALTKHGDRGLAFFTRAILLRPDELTAYELLGNLYVDLNEPAKAREVYEAGLKHAANLRPPAKIYVSLSRVDRMLKQPQEAARIAREGLQRAGEDAELYHALGSALGELGENEAAVEALRNAASRNAGDARTNYDLAVALIAVHQLDEAVEALHRSLTLEPTFPATLALLAQIEIDSGRWRNAGQYLRPLYEAHPELPDARAQMANYYLRCGLEAEQSRDLAAAVESYRNGIAVDDTVAELQGRLGVLFLMQRQFSDAIAPLEAYHRLEPANPQAGLFLGQAYAATARRQEARQTLAEAIRTAERAGNPSTAQHAREVLQRIP